MENESPPMLIDPLSDPLTSRLYFSTDNEGSPEVEAARAEVTAYYEKLHGGDPAVDLEDVSRGQHWEAGVGDQDTAADNTTTDEPTVNGLEGYTSLVQPEYMQEILPALNEAASAYGPLDSLRTYANLARASGLDEAADALLRLDEIAAIPNWASKPQLRAEVHRLNHQVDDGILSWGAMPGVA